MTSKDFTAFVWVMLAGDVEPTVCARLDVSPSPGGGMQVLFVYGSSYLRNPGAVPLDPVRLPLSNRTFQTIRLGGQGDPDVFGVIADACPDDWGRYVITRRHGPQLFPIGFLLRSQDDRVGNLCFSSNPGERPILGEPASIDLLDDAWAVVMNLDSGRPIPAELENRVRANTGMGGARPKLTVSDGTHQWLAKFPSHRDDRRYSQARLEAATLDLAARCGINAATAKLHVVQPGPGHDGGVVALVRRFDRTRSPTADGWLRDAYVSARTVMTSDPAHNEVRYMGGYGLLAEELQRWSSNAAADRRELYRRMVFNCCVSNTDDHDRNHGLLADELGTGYRLSPAFDIVPRLHGTVRRFQAMPLGRGDALVTVENLLASAPAFKIPEPEAQGIIDEVQHGVAEHWRSCLEARGMTPEEIELLASCFQELPRDEVHIEQLIQAKASLPRDNGAPGRSAFSGGGAR